MNEQQQKAVQDILSRKDVTSKLEADNDMIHSTFYDNMSLLKSMRNVLTHLTASDEDKERVRSVFSGNEALTQIVADRFYHEYREDEPIGVNQNFWSGTDQQLLGMTKDGVAQVLGYKKLVLENFRTIKERLMNPDAEVERELTEDSILADDTGAAAIAFIVYTNAIENGLNAFVSIANSIEQKKTESGIDHSK